jgi:hypothetical protein
MIFHTILPLVLPLTAQPSARLEAEDTLPPFFIIGSPGLPPIPGAGNPPPVVGAGPIGLTPCVAIGIGAGLPTGTCAGAPVTVGLTLGLEGAAGNGLAGTLPGAYLII